MSETDKSNFESFLDHISPNVSVTFPTQNGLGSSQEVRKPHVSLRDVWSAYEEWGNFARGVPLTLKNNARTNTTQYYVPTLSAIQIFTTKPFPGGSFLSVGTDKYLYFEHNATMRFDDRPPLHVEVYELADQHHGLKTLTTSDLAQDSWFSVAWSPIYQIPEVENMKALSVCFLTYHSLTPLLQDACGRDGKVALPAFGAVTTELSGEVWNMPETSDEENIIINEEHASSWLGKVMFKHSDFDLFKTEEARALPVPSGW